MKINSISNLRTALIAAVVALGPMSFHMQAQGRGTLVRVNVPFAFQSGTTRYNAGTYLVSSPAQHMTLLRGSSTSGVAMMQERQDKKPAEVSKVVFHKYGDHYFISDIFSQGSTDHLHIFETKEEKTVRAATEERRNANQTVAVLAQH